MVSTDGGQGSRVEEGVMGSVRMGMSGEEGGQSGMAKLRTPPPAASRSCGREFTVAWWRLAWLDRVL